MGILEEIEKVISRMRQELYEIIDNKENLLDIDVINASQKLDSMLNIYNELLKNK
ncbi:MULTISPECIES: aspartyl-phosphate phosphatase Spo0E family protein [unclassified Clostridium]|uniref:aspartyl-phosphate phosphatase Spo0E family protein n=1 Tax=unclassified Clostridium TaxID=2614128 RepID=UPI000297E564|nr:MULTISPECIES: aspartyl-phosphate phosphatase Spo0E family protein [unclassified Clostridium]EKQ56040.1 MAG: Spo0E like sporulation regulatory protein [Clostridium sp. Maddingley MBC34-26]